MALQSALEECVNTGLTACMITLLASKELYKIVLQGRFAASYHEVDDLMKGLQPFTCSFQGGGGQPAVYQWEPSRLLAAPPPKRAPDGLAKCYN